MTDLLIKNGTLVNHDQITKSDLLIVDEKINQINCSIEVNNTPVIDAQGLLIFPGGIDVHTHLDLPVMGTHSADDFESGTNAALHGGTTTIIDFANQQKGQSLKQALDLWKAKAFNKSYVDYSFHLSVTDPTPSVVEEMLTFNQQGITSFKTFLAYDSMMINPDQLRSLLKLSKQHKFLITIHAEDGKAINSNINNLLSNGNSAPKFHPISRPIDVEVAAIEQIIKICQEESAPIYIVHLSSKRGLELIYKAQKNGIKIFAETCPQYLMLDDGRYQNDLNTALNNILSPPLRTKENQQSLWQGIIDETIAVLATDHCPFQLDQKLAGKENFTKVPNGLPGIENRLDILYSEGYLKRKMPLTTLVKAFSYNPAKIFGLHQKGRIEIGMDADLVLFDPNKTHKLSHQNQKSKCTYNPYDGLEIEGKISTVIHRGRVALQNDLVKTSPSYGRFIPRAGPQL